MTPISITRDRISWWVGLPREQFQKEAQRRADQIAESTFGTWSNKAPTSVLPSQDQER